ncbi:MAG: glycogen/starch/alpha-glucan phosphorylase, partial [Clostridiales bacterium]|nr:glycogen/starch/alpha-glucan phosphorylase [Clostridiales bacterium]
MAIVKNDKIHMANLAIAGSHNVNGVSQLHSQILKDDVFASFSNAFPGKFINVTNGIASRRWLMQANPGLTALITEAIGDGFKRDMNEISKLNKFENDEGFLKKMAEVKHRNKEDFCAWLTEQSGVVLNPDSIFDVHVKRLHEYKRQQLGALDIIASYLYLKDHPNAEFYPRSYIFGAKAAPGYFMAKQIISLLCKLSEIIEKDPAVRNKIKVHFMEDYNVTKMERILPASEISEQISLAGTEASGTGNMKLMINGAITLGTLDGANVEIHEAVGDENILIFGMTAEQVEARRAAGYSPKAIYDKNHTVKRAVDALIKDLGKDAFPDVNEMLMKTDYYMTLADFDSYRKIRELSAKMYQDTVRWQQMSLRNIAESAIFCADRSIRDYAQDIWRLSR